MRRWASRGPSRELTLLAPPEKALELNRLFDPEEVARMLSCYG